MAGKPFKVGLKRVVWQDLDRSNLVEATDAGRQAIPMLCMDEDGIDRAAIHQKVSAWAVEFFEKTLKVS